MLYVWYIYLHLCNFWGKCRYIFHTWSIWVFRSYSPVIRYIAIEAGPVEIVDLPINSMVIFHSYVNVYQRVGILILRFVRIKVTLTGVFPNHSIPCHTPPMHPHAIFGIQGCIANLLRSTFGDNPPERFHALVTLW